MKVNIVGLQYRGLSKDFIEKIGQSELIFKCEANNKYDKNAVQCITNGIHFGYIEKDKSQYINTLIKTSNKFTYKIISRDQYKLCLELTVNATISNSAINNNNATSKGQISITNDANFSGVYRINFNIDGDKLSYIGQSTNIAKRIQAHLKELKNGTHHNKKLQYAWLNSPNSFNVEVLHKSTEKNSQLEKQIELFENELYYIELEGGRAVNAIEGDLVFTKAAIDEFDLMNKEFKKVIREIRAVENHKKLMLGKLILDLRIMDRVNKRLQHAEVKDTNVITWLNKKRFSPLDYVPKIRYEVNGSKKLIDALQNLNTNLKNVSIDNVFTDEFKQTLFKKRSSYETCDRRKLRLYLDTIRDYLGPRSHRFDIASYKTVSNGRISYDSSLLEIFDKPFLDSLTPYVD